MGTRGGPLTMTLAERQARYDDIIAMRAMVPPKSYAAIGVGLDLTSVRVRTIALGGPPRPSGRPPRK
jgi:hypothetical protein